MFTARTAMFTKRKRDRRRRVVRLELLEARQLFDAALATHIVGPVCDDLPCLPTDAHVDHEGNMYYVDPMPMVDESLVPSPAPVVGGSLPESIPLASLPVYHSLPGATKKIVLDFDGHTVSGTPWNSSNQNNPIHAVPYDTDGNINDFSTAEQTAIFQTWQRVAEDYAPYQVDVTTEEPTAAEINAGSTALRVVVSTDVDDTRVGGTGYRWYSGAGGVAYVGSWSWSNAVVWAFYNNLASNEKYMAEAISHEAGHALGLTHDGRITPSEGYYQGQGSGATGWAPIMGVGYYKELSQWSKGEYTSANNTQDDLAIINQRLAYRVDEDGSTNATARSVTSSNVNMAGIITTRQDVDVFSLELATGSVNLAINPAIRGPNLDILAELYNASGTLMVSSNPLTTLNANISFTIATPGTYYLNVSGVGKGDPLVDGYTDYGSLGQYTVTGTMPYAPDAVVLAPSNLAVAEVSESSLQLSWTDSATNETQFVVQRSTDSASWTTIATPPANTTTFTDTGLIAASRYYYRVQARNGLSESAFSAVASGITLGPPPAVPTNLAGVAQTGGTQINLTWSDNSPNETNFTLQRSTDGAIWTTIGSPAANVTSFNSTGLSPLTTYYYRVSATNLRGTSDYSAVLTINTLDGIPVAPSNFTATQNTLTSVVLSWIDNANNETDYLLERISFSQSTGGQATWQTIATLPAGSTSFTDTGLTPGTFVQYRVSARNAIGASPPTYSYVSLPEAPPSNVVATAVSPFDVNLSWVDNSQRETGFVLERSLDGATWNTLATLAANTTLYADSGLTPLTTYSYRLRLVSEGSVGTSPGGLVFYSNVATATTPTANHDPAFSGPLSFSLPENRASVGAVLATDVDAGQTLTYSLAAAGDAARFTLNPTTGALAFLAPPDFEAPGDTGGDNVYDLTVIVSDGAGGSATASVSVQVTNLLDFYGTTGNDTFTITPTANPQEVTVTRGTTTLGTFTASDLYFDGAGGNDSLVFNGTAGGDSFSSGTSSLRWLTGNTTVYLTKIGTRTIKSLGGDDTLRIDTPLGGGLTFDGGLGNDVLSGPDQPNLFQITASNAGTLNVDHKFLGVETLMGGANTDEFRFAAAGSVSLGVQGTDGVDAINYSARTSAVSLNLATGKFTSAGTVGGIEQIIGSQASDTLIGANTSNAWNITGANAGDVNGLQFSSLENLTGGTSTDTFNLSGGSVAGKINGGSGNDVLSYAGSPTAASVNLQLSTATGTGGFASFESLVGSSQSDTLIGSNSATIFTLSGANTGLAKSTSFSSFENLVGGTSSDTFLINAGGSVSGTLVGGGGDDLLDYKNLTTPVQVDLLAGIATGTSGVSGIDIVRGGSGSDVILGSDGNDLLIGGPGNDQLDGRGGNNVLFGGLGNDTLIGNAGRDWLVGGSGVDQVIGGAGDDLILGGKANSFYSESSGAYQWALIQAIMTEWTRADGVAAADRVSHLQTGGGLNGTTLLTSQTDSPAIDTMTGGLDADWFFASLNESPTDYNSLDDFRTTV